MKVTQLSMNEQLAMGYSHKVVVSYTDLTDTAGLTKALAIYPDSGTAPIGTCCRRAAARVVTAFVGCATLTVEIGDGNDPNRILLSSDMKATAGTWYTATPATAPGVFNAADTLDALFTATTNNLSALTAGEVEIYVDVAHLSQLH